MLTKISQTQTNTARLLSSVGVNVDLKEKRVTRDQKEYREGMGERGASFDQSMLHTCMKISPNTAIICTDIMC